MQKLHLPFYKLILVFIAIFSNINVFAQIHTNQNGIQTTVINAISANGTQARRFEVAAIGYNSYSWQAGGLLIIELFHQSYATGYEKYSIEVGWGQGAQGSPAVRLVESGGFIHNAKILLGDSYDLGTSSGDYTNKGIPIYIDVKYYSTYKVKITYLQSRVSTLNGLNQIKINESPSPINIADFTTSTEINNNLKITGAGNNYIKEGKLGIGTTNPTEKLEVAGTIRAREVKIEVNAGADYVFEKDYELKPLSAVEQFVKENKHLPEIPSEKEMLEKGLSVNEFQIKLLKKIEELTLYIIEQDKKIEIQNNSIEKLQGELKNLKE